MKKSENILHNKNFTYYFLADIVSGIGSGISFIGFNWFILDVTDSSTNVGLFMALSLFSGLLFFPFAGTIADRFSRRKVLILLNFLLGGLITALSILVYLDILVFEIVYLIAVVNGVGFAIFIPASRGLIQELVHKDDLIQGNSLIEISLQISTFLAAGLTGIIYKYYGFSIIILIDGITFFLAAFFLTQIRYNSIEIEDKEDSFSTQFFNGIKYLNKNRLIMGFGIFILIPFAVTISSNVILPAYISKYLKAGSIEFGFAEMCYGFGAFLAGFFISRLITRDSIRFTIVFFYLFSITALSYLYLNHFIVGLYVAYFSFGLANTSLKIVLNTLLMEVVPKKQFGRAMAFFMAISSIIQMVCTFGIGGLIDQIPSNYGYLILAILMVTGLIAITALLPAFLGKRSEVKSKIQL
jgi:MFS family permease